VQPRNPQELERVAIEYAISVLDGRLVVGRLQRLAIERDARDRAAGPDRGLRFNATRGLRAAWWIENRLRLSKGIFAGRPFVLSAWQVWALYTLFGWERLVGDEWLRRFRKAYLSMGRKNGKTELVAGIGLAFLFPALGLGGEIGGEIYSAATKRDQAAICWDHAAKMVRRSPELRDEISIHDSRYNLAAPESESKFEAVAADSTTLDGLGPVLVIVDEYHEHPTSQVMDVLESGQGARREPLTLVITTAGGKRSGPCWDLEQDALRALEGVGGDDVADELFALVCRLDDADDPFDPGVWIKANPNLGVSVREDFIATEARTAKRQPRKVNEFLRKHCNSWTETSVAWLPLTDWDRCDADVIARPGTGRRAYVGVDLSSTSDYTAAVALLEPGEDGFWDVLPAFWIPAETLEDRARVDRVPVQRWVDSGLVYATAGNVVDQDALKGWLLNLRERFDVVAVPMDPHNATKLQTELIALGFPVISMRQGWVTMSPAIKQTETWIRQGKLRHGGNPVLRWMFANVALKRDQNDNLALHKGRSADRIDGIVSLCMAVGRASVEADGGEVRIWGIA
jgi:phage terminase large subunit-like protein